MATRMGYLGNVGAFDPDQTIEDWPTYCERFHVFCAANEINEEKKVSVFLSTVGAKTYNLIRTLCSPDKPSEKSLEDLCKIVKTQLSPKPLVIAERYRFYKRSQEATESIADYVAVLKKLSEHCEFGEQYKDALRDRLVMGLRNESVVKRLLTEANLTFDKAQAIAVAMETAARDSREVSGQTGATADVNKVKTEKFHKDVKFQPNKINKPCWRCYGVGHAPEQCFFKDQQCRKCGSFGHIRKTCRNKERFDRFNKPAYKKFSRKKGGYRSTKVKQVSGFNDNTESSSDSDIPVKTVRHDRRSEPITLKVKVDSNLVDMELDTGAGVSLISKEQYMKLFPDKELIPTDLNLSTYTEECVTPLGFIKVDVDYNNIVHKDMELFVTSAGGPPLFGRDWLKSIKLDWSKVSSVNYVADGSSKKLELILEKHQDIFAKDIGTIKKIKAKVVMKDGAIPKFCKPRPVAYALRHKIEEDLNRLVHQGIISPVEHSEWATPIVPVHKSDGSLRICGDFKVTVNPELIVDQYPLPRIEDMFSKLSGGCTFSKIDLAHAYLQMELEEDAKQYLVINTHKGLFAYNRLPFGISSAPSIFQRGMEQILSGLSGVQCYLDDILITGSSEQEHLRNLDQVMDRLSKYGIHVNLKKCEFFKSSVSYLGHIIDSSGLHTNPEKVSAVLDAPIPENIQQLRSFLGMINYYGRFLPMLSTVLRPLNQLLSNQKKWKWTAECNRSFCEAKKLLVSSAVLTHYSLDLPIVLACDASPYGIGAVISHVFPNGEEKPIAFASRTLNKSEKNYSQIEKEALSIIYGVKKFHQYLYARKFTLITDHRPLTTIFGPKTGIPKMVASRLQRWALFLSGHNYEIQYKQTNSHCNADGLSRLPLTCVKEPDDTLDIHLLSEVNEHLPVTSEMISKEIRKDRLLSRVLDYTLHGWNYTYRDIDPDLTPYIRRKDELSVLGGCLMWGNRVIIPPKFRPVMLRDLHEAHLGIIKMKGIARSYLWWPGLDSEIETMAKSCETCCQIQNNPPLSPLHPWMFPTGVWQRLHMDFAGPFQGHTFFIVVDAYTKWPEVIEMNSTTSGKTIEALRDLFYRYGLPEHIVSDNGTQFTSKEFAYFTKSNGIRHTFSAPHHPATNGLAERFVQTLKQGLKAMINTNITIKEKLGRFLFAYRNAPQSTTKTCPSELFFGRHLRSRMDLLKPNLQKIVQDKQYSQMKYREPKSKFRNFEISDTVKVRDYRGHSKWKTGVVIDKTGPTSFLIEVEPGCIWRRHLDQILPHLVCPDNMVIPEKDHVTVTHNPVLPSISVYDQLDAHSPRIMTNDNSQGQSQSPVVDSSHKSPEKVHSPKSVQNARPTVSISPGVNQTDAGSPITVPRRYPLRENRQPPKRLDL